jgi:hypothetical protein
MNEQIKNWYLELPDDKKQIFLAFVSNSLTIHGRGFGLELSGEKQIAAFKGLNELQHQLSSHIAAIGMRSKRYPDDALWEILAEKAVHYNIDLALLNSLKYARSRTFWTDGS